MHVARRVLPIIVSLWTVGCATRANALTDAPYPVDPFELELTVVPAEVAAGESVTLRYVLKNITEHAVSACADAWNTYHVLGTKGEQGMETTQLDRPLDDRILRVPPNASLVWTTDVAIKDIGVGQATVRGTLRSSAVPFGAARCRRRPFRS